MRKQGVFLAALLVGMAALVQGCVVAAVGAGAGTAVYVMGEFKAYEARDLTTVYMATQKAMEQLQLNVTAKTKDAMSATTVGRDSADTKITVKLSAAPEQTTKISIRVGTFGDETKSRLIYDQIKKNL
ncbi:MAG: DUF3568 family protein [Planctomycetota bacterium]|nr:MAG: DUF3568 family protein [Planctomycetota bacterium]